MAQDGDTKFIQIWEQVVKEGGTMEDVAIRLRISVRSARRRRQRVEERKGIKLDMPKNQQKNPSRNLELAKLNNELREEKEKNRQLTSMALTSSDLESLIHGLKKIDRRPPDWTRRTPTAVDKHGVPTLLLTDLHFGEVVRPEAVNGVNVYDLDIAKKRLWQVVETATSICYDALSSPDYPGIVVPFGGDFYSGYIHEELRENKADYLFSVVIALLNEFNGIIKYLKQHFGKVFVPCVVGNHGRIDRKPRCKGYVQDNVDWLTYQLLARDFANDEDVVFGISDSHDYMYQVYNTRYLFHHGEQFRGGTGISGAWTPWALGDARKRKRQQAISKPYDIMLMGHWHQMTWLPNIIVNGSLVGYDEFAYSKNFGFERPQQGLWMTHPQHGVTCRWNVFADNGKAEEATPWVSVFEAA